MADELKDCTIAILLAPQGTEQAEFEEPINAVEKAGGRIVVIGAEKGETQTVNNDLESGDLFEVDETFADASPDDYDGLIVPGGTIGADTLRANADAVEFIRGFFEQDKPVGVICHGPWTLVEADLVRGRTLTSFPSLQTDIRNAGGNWVDEEVVTDNGLVTSRKPSDLPAFCDKIVEEFAEGKHPQQGSSV
ncbi:MAG TPA: type 1 glutamine amidotransferase domain-containing protein [Salinisphaeraceae bacterium]|nr:type 1 glutamine amidotransferase domain-containing protein [Salinisphaeraceae bacterium]